jgi:hypothetical protein
MDGLPAYPIRASDVQRDRVVEELANQVAQGRMSTDTFERRLGRALQARSEAELVDLIHDLPPRNRLVDRVVGAISSLSAATARIESAWRMPRLPRFLLPSAQTRILVGRAPGCHFVLTDLTVSRFHAEIYQDGHGWVITDLGSMNGTRVNGWRLTGSAPVHPGDQIGFGNSTFVVAAN